MATQDTKSPRPKLARTPAEAVTEHFAGRPINKKNLERAKQRALNNRMQRKHAINRES